MKQTIGYDKDELTNTLEYIKSQLELANSFVQMMEDQGKGNRTNLDWASTSRYLKGYLSNIKRYLNVFGLVKFNS